MMRTFPRPINLRPRPALLSLALFVADTLFVSAQTPSASQPLNASVSDYGTSFVFSPPPVCPGCVETELGFLSLEDGRYMPAVVTVALPHGKTDASVLVNLMDSESPSTRRATHFGNRFDFVLRQQLAAKGGFEMTLAPHGTIFVRGGDGGRAGAAIGPQYTWGRNLAILNLTWTGAVGVSPSNPRSDYLTSFDYYPTLDHRGNAFFLGTQQEETGGVNSVGVEQGVLIAFRNGQVELANQQLNLNIKPQWQFQTRVIVNWGNVLRGR